MHPLTQYYIRQVEEGGLALYIPFPLSFNVDDFVMVVGSGAVRTVI